MEARIAELEMTLEAIRRGDVDGIVVHGEAGDRVFTLTGTDEAYRVLIESLGEGATTLAADGTILYANASMGALLGEDMRVLLGQDLSKWLAPAPQGTGPRDVLALILSPPAEGAMRMEVTMRRSVPGQDPGPTFPALLTVSRVPNLGAAKVTFSALDLTEIKHARELLEQRVKERTAALQQANAELEAFAYSVSHDLRAPLRAIEAYSGTLLEEDAHALSPSGRANLERVRLASKRMSLLIQEILTMSRLTRSEMHAAQVDVTALAGSILTRLREADPGRLVQATVEPGLDATADPVLLDAVLTNLLDNAWKFTSHRKGATIHVGRAKTPQGSAFFIRDNGAGFDQEFIGQLFLPFRRLHHDSEFPGTGIGLATVKRLVTRHGGTVWAEGAVGRGATFYFTLGPEGHP